MICAVMMAARSRSEQDLRGQGKAVQARCAALFVRQIGPSPMKRGEAILTAQQYKSTPSTHHRWQGRSARGCAQNRHLAAFAGYFPN